MKATTILIVQELQPLMPPLGFHMVVLEDVIQRHDAKARQVISSTQDAHSDQDGCRTRANHLIGAVNLELQTCAFCDPKACEQTS